MQIACIGAGSWGTTLSIYLARLGHDVYLQTRTPERAQLLQEQRENRLYLPDAHFPETLSVGHANDRVRSARFLLVAVPTQFIGTAIKSLGRTLWNDDQIVVNTSKGIEQGTLRFPQDIIADELRCNSDRVVTLSGPSHAEEVSRGDPAALVSASRSLTSAAAVQNLFASSLMRVYVTNDAVGVEVAGAMKNVIALCAGIVDGLQLGDNTKAALLTRGLAEITRLGVSLGARPETFGGLSGIGDLVVTCTSRHSRNRSVGERVGRGEELSDIEGSMEMVAEGVATTRSALVLANRQGIELPITEQVAGILFDQNDPRRAIHELMTRDHAAEE